MAQRGNLSDFWREDASDDRVRELTSVLRGSDSLIGVMGSGVRAVWSTNGESQTWWVRTKESKEYESRVFLDYSPLRELVPPFIGEAVDEVIGYAAHEGGHCLWSSPEGRSEAIGAMKASATLLTRQAAVIPAKVDEVLRVANVLEDAFIDYHVGDDWPVLGEYIHIARAKIHDRRPIDIDAIASAPRPTFNQALNLWIACSLYDADLPNKMSARVRRAMTVLMGKSVEAVQTSNVNIRMALSVECWEVLVKNFPHRPDPLPSQQPPPPPQAEQEQEPDAEETGEPQAGGDTAGDSGDDEGGEAGEQKPDTEGDQASSGGKASEGDTDEADDGTGEADGETGEADDDTGEADADTGEADDAEAEDTEPDAGAEGAEAEDTEPDADAEADAEAEVGGKGQEHGHFSEDADDEAETDETREASEQGGDEQGAPGNLDEFDIRDIDEIPEELLDEILEAITHEMEDISRSVAEVISQPLRDVEAQTQKADYDGPAADKVRQQVQSEIQEIARIFDRQAAVMSRHIKGLTVGKLDTRSLARVGTGSTRVFKRREILETPDLAVGLLLDVSGSMAPQMKYVWSTACVFSEALARKKGVNFLALTYTGGFFHVQTTRICDREMSQICLGNVTQGGGTPSGAAIGSMKVLMDRMPEKQKVIIHFTDGAPDDRYSVVAAVEACRKARYEVWAISLHTYAAMLEQQYGEGNWGTIGAISELPLAVGNLCKRLVATR